MLLRKSLKSNNILAEKVLKLKKMEKDMTSKLTTTKKWDHSIVTRKTDSNFKNRMLKEHKKML